MTVTVGTREPAQVVRSYATYTGWWCWVCQGLGGRDGEYDCICCCSLGEHETVLPPPCAPPAALTGLDRRWWGLDRDEETEAPRG